MGSDGLSSVECNSPALSADPPIGIVREHSLLRSHIFLSGLYVAVRKHTYSQRGPQALIFGDFQCQAAGSGGKLSIENKVLL